LPNAEVALEDEDEELQQECTDVAVAERAAAEVLLMLLR
jgi:hypothetical protein